MTPDSTESVIEIIQLALTPVFLLVGIGTVLSVVTNRVGRVIDRARYFEAQIGQQVLDFTPPICAELKSLEKRLKLANWSVNLLTAAAVVVCLDIFLLMLSGIVSYPLDTLLLGMFMLSLTFITFGLIAFLFEVSVATATLKIPRLQQD